MHKQVSAKKGAGGICSRDRGEMMRGERGPRGGVASVMSLLPGGKERAGHWEDGWMSGSDER